MAFFDDIAISYDQTFSYSNIGSQLRSLGWKMFEKEIAGNGLHILEINCGTGVDALYFASQGHMVTATDASPKMIRVASGKCYLSNPKFVVSSFDDLQLNFRDELFDVIFSNFGGLNCASSDDLEKIFADASSLLKPGGQFIAVVMGSACAWEMAYYLLKRDKRAFRRARKSGAKTVLGSQTFTTYYHSPNQLKRLSEKFFQSTRLAPLGLILPPTYVEHYFAKRPRTLRLLSKLERKITSFSILSNFADHYMIVLKKI